MDLQFTIGIDLGGTNIKGGVCDVQNVQVVARSVATEAEGGFEHVFARMVRLVDRLRHDAGLSKTDVRAIGIGSPGPLSHSRGIIHNAPNLPGWVNVPLREKFSAATGLPVTLENDANAAAYGEFIAGAGKDTRDMVLLTLGTGIGGGIVLDGRLWRGRFNTAAEIGHLIVVPGGRACPCGKKGCLERYGSANAIAERLTEAVLAGEDSLLKPRIEAGESISSQDVNRAAADGDHLAARIWDEACRFLALAAINVQHLLNPECVVYAGGLINAGDRLLEPIEAHFDKERWRIAPDAPKLVFATLGGDAGTIGAAALAREA
jgi:glucokinase